MKKHLASWGHSLSNLCLDAPLVAVGWACWLNRYGTPAAPVEGRLLVGMASAVWWVYLFDRIWDARRLPVAGLHVTVRHRFAQRHRGWLIGLAGVSLALVSALLIPRLDTLSWAHWSIVVAVGVFFALFRLGQEGWVRHLTLSGLPVKELWIGGAFAGGVAIMAGKSLSGGSLVLLAALALLFSANCVAIGWVERQFDERHDPASFSSVAGARAKPWIGGLLAGAVALAWVADWLTGSWQSVWPVGIGALVTAWLVRRPSVDGFQALADACLLVPWLFLWRSA